MKSYLLVTGDFVKTGGMDRANFALADYLARQGIQVHLVAYRVAPELLAMPNVTFHRVPKVGNSYFLSGSLLDWVGRSQAQRIAFPGGSLGTRGAGGRVLVNGGNCQWGDVNWVHYVHAAYRSETRAGLLRQLKESISYRMFLAAEKLALQSARAIVVNSERTKQDIIERLAIAPERIHRVYYGIEPQIFYRATSTERSELRHQLGWSQSLPIVAFIGALGDRRKGFDTLFAAWQQLCADSDWDADLVAIGSGAELPLWQRRAESAGIASRIHFLGFRSDVPMLLRAADCLVAPTRYEAYGLGVHEALCCGLPALVSARAGVAERYPSQLGDLLLPNPEDVADIVARLRRWREATHQYSKMVSTLSEELRCYTWDDMASNIVDKINNS